MKTAKRVIFNTGILYAQLIIGMVIGLFTTRIVLNALGQTNYGIYMLVAGVVGMLGILNSNMTNTSMRYMAHSLGSGNKETIRKTFNTTLYLHSIIGAIVIVLMEVGGWIMFDYLLNVPPDKIFEAKVVFHFMVITTFVTVISVPYDTVINAHENMLFLALVDTFGNILKLGVAICLTFSHSNLLILYGFLMLAVQVLLRIIKQWYAKINYDECKKQFKKYVDKYLIKEILTFTGWNLFGSLAAISVSQLRGILLNMFFGVSLNAAEGISKTASNHVNMVSVSMTRAINPQLIKSEGGGDRKRMLRITEISTKFSVFLFAAFAMPVILEANYLLNIWLKNVPEYAVIFCQLLLLTMLIEKFTFQITHSIRAVGKIREFQVTETLLAVLSVPVSYFAFKAGFGPPAIYVIGILLTCFVFLTRLYFGKKIAGINLKNYLTNGVFSIAFPIILATSLTLAIHLKSEKGLLRLIMVTGSYFTFLTTSFWQWGLKAEEKERLKSVIGSFFKNK